MSYRSFTPYQSPSQKRKARADLAGAVLAYAVALVTVALVALAIQAGG